MTKMLMVAVMLATSVAWGIKLDTGFEYATSGAVVPGEWTSRYAEAKRIADEQRIPLVAFWAKSSCGHCKNLERANTLATVVAWRKRKGYLFVFGINSDGEKDADGITMKKFTKKGSSLPFVTVYWNKDGNKEKAFKNRRQFCGRPTSMLVRPNKSIAGKIEQIGDTFMRSVDLVVGAYKPGEGGFDPIPGGDEDAPVEVLPGGLYGEADFAMEEGEVPYANAAAIYDGYLTDEDGCTVGAIRVNVSRQSRGKSSVSATVSMIGASKSLFRGGKVGADGCVTKMLKGDRLLRLRLGKNGLCGILDGKFRIDGARNVFKGKTEEDDFAAESALASCQGPYAVAWDNGVLLATVGRGGKVKIAGVADGVKVRTTGQLLVGEHGYLIPVVATKKSRPVALALRIANNGKDVTAEGFAEGDVRVGVAGELAAGATFGNGDGEEILAEALADKGTLYGEYLPEGRAVTVRDGKWVVEDGTRGRVAFARGSTEKIDRDKLGENPSSLKLVAKGGEFSGSYLASYRTNGKRPRIATVRVSLSGVMIGDTGYGVATAKGISCKWTVTIGK